MSTHYLALDIGSTTVVAPNVVGGTASAATSAADKRISRSCQGRCGVCQLQS